MVEIFGLFPIVLVTLGGVKQEANHGFRLLIVQTFDLLLKRVEGKKGEE